MEIVNPIVSFFYVFDSYSKSKSEFRLIKINILLFYLLLINYLSVAVLFQRIKVWRDKNQEFLQCNMDAAVAYDSKR
jgi:hypothetical protein